MASADVLVAVLEEGREKQVSILCDGDTGFSICELSVNQYIPLMRDQSTAALKYCIWGLPIWELRKLPDVM